MGNLNSYKEGYITKSQLYQNYIFDKNSILEKPDLTLDLENQIVKLYSLERIEEYLKSGECTLRSGEYKSKKESNKSQKQENPNFKKSDKKPQKQKQQHFTNIWCNQTELGKRFGMSAIAVGKILTKYRLKDSITKMATEMALTEEYAIYTPLQDGTTFFMWNIEKCKELLSQNHIELSKIDYYVNEVLATLKEAEKLEKEGQDKMAYMMLDYLFDDIPFQFRQKVKDKLNAMEFSTDSAWHEFKFE